MSGESITMMVVAMMVLWGGLTLAIVNLLLSDARSRRKGRGVRTGDDHLTRDL